MTRYPCFQNNFTQMSTILVNIFISVLFLDGLYIKLTNTLLIIVLLESFKVALITLLSKIWIYAIGIISAVFAKLSYDVLTGRKLTLVKSLAITCVSLFVGALITMGLIMTHYPLLASIFGPLATFMGEKILIQVASDQSIKDFIHAARIFLGNYIKPKE
jgi:hypothetical protein